MKEINRSDVFSAMLQDIPWSALKSCLQGNPQILKRCTAGGHRLEVKSRKRIEKIILQEVEKQDFPEALCNAVFAFWYPLQKEFHERLEQHFHSDAYAAYRQEQGLDENAYVLTDSEFDSFFNISDLQKWRVLLCFSPLTFSEQQARQILDQSQGNTELLARVEELEAALAGRDSSIARLNNELSSTRSRLDPLNLEVQALRTEKRELQAEQELIAKKVEIAQKGNLRLQRELEEARKLVEQIRKENETLLVRKTKLLSDEAARLEQELRNWQEKYEKQHNRNSELELKIQKIERSLAEERIANDKSRKELKRVQNYADLILQRIDWAEIGKQIKLTPQLKLRFNSLIRNLHYDENNRPRMNLPIEKFWDKLQAQEKKLIDNIAKSDTYEVEFGDVEDYWRELEDAFEDVQIGLESRTILIQLLHEIFYQTIDIRELKTDTIPNSMTKSKRSS